MNANLFHLIFVIAFFAMFTLRLYFGRKARRAHSDVDIKESKLNLALRALFGLGYIAALVVYAFIPDWFSWAAIELAGWIRWIGAFITLSSVLLLWWVQAALDVQFNTSLHTQADHKLITSGPYRWVRHPMYSVLFLMGLGWFLLTANWFVGLPLIIGIVLVVLARVKNEEAVLTDLFGDEYRNYMKRTGRFLPRLTLG